MFGVLLFLRLGAQMPVPVLSVLAPADVLSEPARAEAPRLQLNLIADAAGQETLARRLPDFLADLAADMSTTRAASLRLEQVLNPGSDENLARAYVDATDSSKVRIFIVDTDATHVFIRTLKTEGGLDVVAVDEIGHVLASAFEALLSGGSIGVTRSEAARALGEAPEPSPAPERTEMPEPNEPGGPAARLCARAGYGFMVAGPSTIFHGPRAGVSLGAALPKVDISIEIEGRLHLPVEVPESGPLALRLFGGGIRVRPSIDTKLRGAWALRTRAGAGVDFIRDTPIAHDGEAVAFAPALRPSAMIDLGVGPVLELGGPRRFAVASLLATLDIAATRFTYRAADGGPVLLDPFVLRPGAVLSIGWGHRAQRAR